MMFLSDSLVRLCPVAPPHVQCYISTGTFTTRATGAKEFLRKQAVKFLVESLKGIPRGVQRCALPGLGIQERKKMELPSYQRIY